MGRRRATGRASRRGGIAAGGPGRGAGGGPWRLWWCARREVGWSSLIEARLEMEARKIEDWRSRAWALTLGMGGWGF